MTIEEYLENLRTKYGEHTYIYKQTVKAIKEGREIKVLVQENGNVYCYIGQLNTDALAKAIASIL